MIRPLTILLWFLAVSATAESISWHDGVLVLKDRTVLVGKITLQPAANVLLFKTGDTSAFYRFEQVDYVTYHDALDGLQRKFISIPFSLHDRTSHQLCEVVLSGRISVVRRPISAYIPDVADVASYEYFVYEDGKLVRLTQFRKKVFPEIAASYSKRDFKSFLRKKGLDPNSNPDAIRLIEYYNEGAITSAPAWHTSKALF